MGTAIIISITAAFAPARATPPWAIWLIAKARGFSSSEVMKTPPVVAHKPWNIRIIRVSQAGLTFGITILYQI